MVVIVINGCSLAYGSCGINLTLPFILELSCLRLVQSESLIIKSVSRSDCWCVLSLLKSLIILLINTWLILVDLSSPRSNLIWLVVIGSSLSLSHSLRPVVISLILQLSFLWSNRVLIICWRHQSSWCLLLRFGLCWRSKSRCQLILLHSLIVLSPCLMSWSMRMIIILLFGS